MHPKEFKQEKAATGRLTHLCLQNSEIVMGIGFDDNERVQSLIRDPANAPFLLFPGSEALNLSAPMDAAGPHAAMRTAFQARHPIVFVLDATWALGKKMLKLSPSLQRLPRIMFVPDAPSRFVIKQQPAAGCLSTIEAVHQLLSALQKAGLDSYPFPDQLLGVFDRMQEFQIRCATDPKRDGYRRGAYSAPSDRKPFEGRSASRRARVFQTPTGTSG
jgi:DTW domain-containing protein YfiP